MMAEDPKPPRALADESEDRDRWAVPLGLTPDQRLDWEQARTLSELSRAAQYNARRTEALEKLVESVVKPIVDEAAAWAVTKRRIAEVLWDSGVGPVKTGPTLVAVLVIVGLSIAAQQCGVDPIKLSQEGRGWWDGECVPALEAPVRPSGLTP